jgi:hypothetical protein
MPSLAVDLENLRLTTFRKMHTSHYEAVLSPAQRAQYHAIQSHLNSAVQEVHELPNGFEYRLPASLWSVASTLVVLAHECFGFFDISLSLSHDDVLWLKVTTHAAKENLYEVFPLMNPIG